MNELYIKNVVGKGRGVFSKKDIKSGDVVEISPVIIISGTYYSNITENHEYKINRLKIFTSERTILAPEIINIIFNWSSLTKNGKKDSCVALGYGSLYNSANPSNMRYEADEKNLNLLFVAVVDIPKDTELTVNYSGIDGNNISEGNYWFENKKFIE
jgi:hypothetical protein